MSVRSGRMVCPKCKNMNMIAAGNNGSFTNLMNRYKCINDNGVIFWKFSFSFDEDAENDEDKKTEEELNRLFTEWKCLNATFTGDLFIHTSGCGYMSNTFLSFIPKFYEEKDFTNKKLIEKINYGKIYTAFSLKDQMDVCLKIIDTEDMKLDYEKGNLKDYKDDLNNEINILTLFSDNENSVKFFGSYEKEELKVIILEKCDCNLKQFILSKGHSFTTEEIKKNFLSINNIFKILQEKLVIHRDLKLENFLVKFKNPEKTDYVIKLSDYGISKFTNNTNNIFSGLKGSFDTIAPEISIGKTEKYESSFDIFSLGVIFYQLSHYLNHPFGHNFNKCYNVYEQYFENDNFNIKFDESISDNNFKDLVIGMTKLNPKNRITWQQYFEHPFFK